MNSKVLNYIRKAVYDGEIELEDAIRGTDLTTNDISILSWDEYLELFPMEVRHGGLSSYSKTIQATYKLEQLMEYYNTIMRYTPDWDKYFEEKWCIYVTNGIIRTNSFKTMYRFFLAFMCEDSGTLFTSKNKDIIIDYYRL